MPFVAEGPKVEWLGLALSEAGLVAGGTFVAKSTLGVAVAVLVSATTTAGEILGALAVLKLPNQLVQIASFMVRYSSVVTDELRRMQVAWQARGFTATGIRSWPTVARTAGALFIRSYERGERVHLAMMARGYRGQMDFGAAAPASPAAWFSAALLPASALVLLLLWRLV
jgi:cobalt/nickel transport system permease protein